jgi:PAS domain S-box-containing protein
MFLGQSLIICWLTASRRDAYRRVGSAERQYHTLADSIPHLVWISNCDGDNVYHNHRLFEYTGLHPQESLAHWEQIVHPQDRERAVAGWRESLRTGKPYEIHYRLRSRDGSYRWFLGRATPLRDHDGKIIVWFGTATDIERKSKLLKLKPAWPLSSSQPRMRSSAGSWTARSQAGTRAPRNYTAVPAPR